MIRENNRQKTKKQSVTIVKKSYSAPRIVDFGHISALTAGTVGSFLDEGHLANQHGH
jgi:hypothetical protein